MSDSHYICSIDQGTSSSRVIIYNSEGDQIACCQKELEIICPQPGWAEQDPMDLLQTITDCIDEVLKDINTRQIKGVGITNQRETTIVWDKITGKPLYNSIVWLDTRNADICDEFVSNQCKGDKDYLREKCGLPVATYFSATKLLWLIQNVPEVQDAIKEERCLFGTVDSWLIWKLTKEVHATDVTNASRTMLMNLATCEWDESLCKMFQVPMSILPSIKSSSEIYGEIAIGPLKGIPIAGVLGDQQAALVGQACFHQGEAKNTYGTGCFMLFNTGEKLVQSTAGLLTTVAYRFGPDQPVIYALEGSIAVAGAAVKWLKNNLGIISAPSDMDVLAGAVKDTGGVYFVPAFSGLFAPHWRDDARGVIVGLSQYSNKNHIVRALLEAVAFQTKEIMIAMEKDSKVSLQKLKVDGGMTNSKMLLQIQSDLLGIPVVKPSSVEATAFGAAFAAGLAVGVYSLKSFVSDVINPKEIQGSVYNPTIDSTSREKRFSRWKMAIERSLNWGHHND